MKEERDRNSSAPITPSRYTSSAKTIITRPDHDGSTGMLANTFLLCQMTKIEKAGTKNPCEKFGSIHQSWTRKPRMPEYRMATNTTRPATSHNQERSIEVPRGTGMATPSPLVMDAPKRHTSY